MVPEELLVKTLENGDPSAGCGATTLRLEQTGLRAADSPRIGGHQQNRSERPEPLPDVTLATGLRGCSTRVERVFRLRSHLIQNCRSRGDA